MKKNDFEIKINPLTDSLKCSVNVYYKNIHWATLFKANDKIFIKFHSHPSLGEWEFMLDDAMDTLVQSKNTLLMQH